MYKDAVFSETALDHAGILLSKVGTNSQEGSGIPIARTDALRDFSALFPLVSRHVMFENHYTGERLCLSHASPR